MRLTGFLCCLLLSACASQPASNGPSRGKRVSDCMDHHSPEYCYERHDG